MQQDTLHRRDSQISTKLGTARTRLQDFRRNLSNPFRKSQKNAIEIFPPPSGGRQLECSQHLCSAPPVLMFPFQDSVADSFSSIMDGAAERMFRKSQMSQARPANVSAIFVHAGAGYHSTTNEHIHLGACDRFVLVRHRNRLQNELEIEHVVLTLI
jgi:taspase (threonine aspartase 1)